MSNSVSKVECKHCLYKSLLSEGIELISSFSITDNLKNKFITTFSHILNGNLVDISDFSELFNQLKSITDPSKLHIRNIIYEKYLIAFNESQNLQLLTVLFPHNPGQILDFNGDQYIFNKFGSPLKIKNYIDEYGIYIGISKDGYECIIDGKGNIDLKGDYIQYLQDGHFYCEDNNKPTIVDKYGNRLFMLILSNQQIYGFVKGINSNYLIVKNLGLNDAFYSIIKKSGDIAFGNDFKQIHNFATDSFSNEFIFGQKGDHNLFFDIMGNICFYSEGFHIHHSTFINFSNLLDTKLHLPIIDKTIFNLHIKTSFAYGINKKGIPALIDKSGNLFFQGYPGYELGKNIVIDKNGNIGIEYLNSYGDPYYVDYLGHEIDSNTIVSKINIVL